MTVQPAPHAIAAPPETLAELRALAQDIAQGDARVALGARARARLSLPELVNSSKSRWHEAQRMKRMRGRNTSQLAFRMRRATLGNYPLTISRRCSRVTTISVL